MVSQVYVYAVDWENISINVSDSPCAPYKFPSTQPFGKKRYLSRISEQELPLSHKVGKLQSRKTDKRTICATLRS